MTLKAPLYITTPIYYVNDIPHIGHAYTSIASDMIARFGRLQGREVFYLTGTDEHGQKVEAAAQKNAMDPQAWVDAGAKKFEELATFLDLTHGDFIRTTEPRHKEAAQHLWNTLLEKGHIYLGSYAGWYSVRDEAFYDESEIKDGLAPTGAPVEWVEEPSYFFRLSAFQEPLLKFYQDNPDFIAPQSRKNEVIKFVEGGLRDLSVSRSTFTWGIHVPGDTSHVMYVWMDALTNYITALGYPNENDSKFQKFWPESLHIIGKDILRFHAVYWPAFLMGAGVMPPKKLFAHGWWTNEGQKMSKSLGNALSPIDLVNTYGLDQVKYFVLREMPFGQDGDFSKSACIQRINSDLANDFGNLVQRVLSFVFKNAGAQVPEPGAQEAIDQELLNTIQGCFKEMESQMDVLALHRACEALNAGVSAANRYIETVQPWGLRKTDVPRMNTVLYTLMEVIRVLGTMALCITPRAAAKILDYLAIPEDKRTFEDLTTFKLIPGTALPEPTGVFPRITLE